LNHSEGFVEFKIIVFKRCVEGFCQNLKLKHQLYWTNCDCEKTSHRCVWGRRKNPWLDLCTTNLTSLLRSKTFTLLSRYCKIHSHKNSIQFYSVNNLNFTQELQIPQKVYMVVGSLGQINSLFASHKYIWFIITLASFKGIIYTWSQLLNCRNSKGWLDSI